MKNFETMKRLCVANATLKSILNDFFCCNKLFKHKRIVVLGIFDHNFLMKSTTQFFC